LRHDGTASRRRLQLRYLAKRTVRSRIAQAAGGLSATSRGTARSGGGPSLARRLAHGSGRVFAAH